MPINKNRSSASLPQIMIIGILSGFGYSTWILAGFIRLIESAHKKNRRARAGELTALWRDAINKNISVDTCKRVMERMGYGFYTAKEKPLLTKKQKTNSLKLAQEHRNWTKNQWREIIWSDESIFEVTVVGDERTKVIREKGEGFHKDFKRKVKFPASLMIWGCMSAQGVGGLQVIVLDAKGDTTKW